MEEMKRKGVISTHKKSYKAHCSIKTQQIGGVTRANGTHIHTFQTFNKRIQHARAAIMAI